MTENNSSNNSSSPKKIRIHIGVHRESQDVAKIDVMATTHQANMRTEDVSIEVGVDAVALITLAIAIFSNVISAVFSLKNSHDIKSVAPKNIITKIKPQDVEQDKRIEATMNRIMGICGASRVAIALFTNGNDAHIFPFKYFSILWEICDNGVAETKPKYQKVPIIKIKGELERCFKSSGRFVVYSVNEELPDGCKNHLIANNIHTALSRLIGSEKDGYIGIINIQFDANPTLSESTMDRIDEGFVLLESLLNKRSSNTRWFPFS